MTLADKIYMNKLILHRRAQKGLRGLSQRETKRALIALNDLSEQYLSSLQQGHKVYRMKASEGGKFYVYKSSPRIRIIFKQLSDRILEVEDVVSHDTLEKYFNWRGE